MLTAALVGTGIAQWIAIGRQIRLGRDEFNATHRPRLKVRKVYVTGFQSSYPTAPIIPGEKLEAALEIANIGDAAAEIVDSKYTIYFGKRRYDQIYYGSPPRRLQAHSMVIPLGGRRLFGMEDVVGDVAPEGSQIRSKWSGDWNLYVIGEVDYIDAGKNIRTLGFCREFRSDQRFHPVKDADFEYLD